MFRNFIVRGGWVLALAIGTSLAVLVSHNSPVVPTGWLSFALSGRIDDRLFWWIWPAWLCGLSISPLLSVRRRHFWESSALMLGLIGLVMIVRVVVLGPFAVWLSNSSIALTHVGAVPCAVDWGLLCTWKGYHTAPTYVAGSWAVGLVAVTGWWFASQAVGHLEKRILLAATAFLVLICQSAAIFRCSAVVYLASLWAIVATPLIARLLGWRSAS